MKLLIMIAFCFISLAHAEETQLRLLKIFSNKKEFVIQRIDSLEEGQAIKVKNTVSSQTKEANVTMCKQKSCLARLEAGIFEMNPKNQQNYTISMAPSKKMSIYGGYGSPLGGAFRLGVRRPINQSSSYGVVLGRIQNKLESTELTANSLSGQYIYKILRPSKFELNILGEVGVAFALLNFEEQGDKASEKVNTYMVSIALEALYKLDAIALGLNVGSSKNGLDSSYSGSQGEFSNPYAKSLVFVEFGVHYQF